MRRLYYFFNLFIVGLFAVNASAQSGTTSLRAGSIDAVYHLLSPHVYDKTGNEAPNDYALIISGGVNKENNHIQYWNDCSRTYQFFTDVLGIPKKNIEVYMADGLDERPESLIACDSIHLPIRNMPDDVLVTENGAFRYYTINAPTDLDGDGEPDINGPASWSDIWEVFRDRLCNVEKIDRLWIFVTDHGDSKTHNICLWDTPVVMSPDDIALCLDKVAPEHTYLFFSQCFSGTFIQPLKADNRTICTATSASRSSWSKNGEFSVFFEKFFDVLAGANYTGDLIKGGDYNQDGTISIEEAFVYAKDHDIYSGPIMREISDSTYEAAQYWSSESDFIYCRNDLMGYKSFIYPIETAGNTYETMYCLEASCAVLEDAEFRSGEIIRLLPGFRVKADHFKAELFECDENAEDWVGDINSVQTPTSLEEAEMERETPSLISLYPNPTDGHFIVDFGGNVGEKHLSIYTASGELVETGVFSGETADFNFSGWMKGVYVIRIVSDNEVFTERLILK